ncbi:MAG: ribose-5-phosphate isomerase [Candidatus Zambryskibacteria bacterium CG_4_9_14_3_um_filter_40_16]|uniref:Ribose-5-phosphate isomerase n=1 Tax=Candidatus Zambryskibacteria bacterium CG_4_9_14_3_um_filter_40_16 TaxID=1975111 RepID=A0A2M7WTR8_9BACT|nr:MAG: ribose-5-phosphate isomerase [Candidatus Zambryskibacteria bacterium CG_4_9_14_3_um_filter_40_16]
MKIYIGTDHAGLAQKEKIIEYLRENGYEVVDKGAHEYDEEDDYPDFAIPVAREVSKNPQNSLGIILGGSGQGEAIVANRFSHVRAAVFYGNAYSLTNNVSNLHFTREHNDANVLCLGSRFITDEEAVQAVQTWINTSFSNGERHKRRIIKIDRAHE